MRPIAVSTVTLLLLGACSEYELTNKQMPLEDPIPEIQVTPLVLDFGMLPIGETAQGFFEIENVGVETLQLENLELNGSAAFALDTMAHGMQLAPGETIDGMVTYTGTEGNQSGKVVIPSDDPATPRARVELFGGAAAADRPVAVCSVDPPQVEAISGTATLVGDQSYDPDGLQIVEAIWSGVLRPAGSQATVPNAPTTQINIPGFNPDMVGTYTFELVVVNEDGVASEPCFTELEAVPAEDLWVEMFWTESGDDMDLHLTRAGGNLESNQDCYYGNCVTNFFSTPPDWGPAGPDGDPALDLDDIQQTGPENINVDTPENVTYGVYVHDYPGSTYQPANTVTVNVYMSGVLAWTDTRDITGENSYTHFADVDWAAQTVIPR